MFSLQKLLLLAALVGAVWYGFKLVSRLQEARQLDRSVKSQRRPVKGGGDGGKAERKEAEEMVRCPVCEAFVAARAQSSCGRPDCPY
ncbi:MAG: hypothetical protein QNJ67_22675 [Kiloniellales bacterium]|nr:hypothetical protein [Kiloniellales bacterium]